MIDLSIVIVSYNTKELTKECLLSIQRYGAGKFVYEAIVVDNTSTDGTIEAIQKLTIRQRFGQEFKIIQNKENLGFSKANNIGVKQAKGRYVLFLNADTLVYAETLETMVKFMDKNQDCGAATCRVELPDGRLDDSCHRGFPTPWRSFCHFSGLGKLFSKIPLFSGYSLGYLDLKKTHEIDSCSGAFIIVRREAGEGINWWDEEFFWYGDDLDFCFRLKEQGWKVYFVQTVKILHYKGVSGGIKDISKHLTVATRETRIRVTNARFEAMKIFYKKHYEKKYPKVITSLVLKGISLKRWFTLKTL